MLGVYNILLVFILILPIICIIGMCIKGTIFQKYFSIIANYFIYMKKNIIIRKHKGIKGIKVCLYGHNITYFVYCNIMIRTKHR